MTSSHLRPASSTNPAHSALQARITQKRAELQNLQDLRDLSGTLTAQLEALEHKLSTLRDGAQAVALVLANWENVLGVIRMAGMKVPVPPRDGGGAAEKEEETEKEQELPTPLVRIPVQTQTQTPTHMDKGGGE